jgi:hypothetical protein
MIDGNIGNVCESGITRTPQSARTRAGDLIPIQSSCNEQQNRVYYRRISWKPRYHRWFCIMHYNDIAGLLYGWSPVEAAHEKRQTTTNESSHGRRAGPVAKQST